MMTSSDNEEGSVETLLVKKGTDSSKGNVRRDEMSVEDLLETEWDGCLACNSEKRRAHNLFNSGS